MLSRQTAAERRRNRNWQCQAMAMLEEVSGFPREDHTCTLPRGHWGAHLCWCGWRFEIEMRSWHQPRLPSA